MSKGIQKDAAGLQQGPQNHKDMKDRVHPLLFAADAVEHRADGVGDAAPKQQKKARCRQDRAGLLDEGNDGPAHADIADHGEDLILLHVDGSQRGGNGGETPLENKQSPAQRRINRTDGRQYYGGVAAGNQEIDGAVVNDLHYLLAEAGQQTVIDAGNREGADHGGTVNDGGDNAVDVVISDCTDDTQCQYGDAQQTAQRVGDHISQFFCAAVIGQMVVCQFGSCAHKAYFLSQCL